MNALMAGGLILLWIAIVGALAGYIETQTNPDFTIGTNDCQIIDNATTCSELNQGSYIDAVVQVAFQGITGAPDYVNALYVSIGGALLVLAILLIVSYFVGLIFGGSG